MERIVNHPGVCDASTAVPADDDRFAVAEDEDSKLRVYSVSQPGTALEDQDLAGFLQLRRGRRESDIQASTQQGDYS